MIFRKLSAIIFKPKQIMLPIVVNAMYWTSMITRKASKPSLDSSLKRRYWSSATYFYANLALKLNFGIFFIISDPNVTKFWVWLKIILCFKMSIFPTSGMNFRSEINAFRVDNDYFHHKNTRITMKSNFTNRKWP